MGMFDEILAKCPKCGETASFQSKGGLCELIQYTPESAPLKVYLDALGYPSQECRTCATWFHLAKPVIKKPEKYTVEGKFDWEENNIPE